MAASSTYGSFSLKIHCKRSVPGERISHTPGGMYKTVSDNSTCQWKNGNQPKSAEEQVNKS